MYIHYYAFKIAGMQSDCIIWVCVLLYNTFSLLFLQQAKILATRQTHPNASGVASTVKWGGWCRRSGNVEKCSRMWMCTNAWTRTHTRTHTHMQRVCEWAYTCIRNIRVRTIRYGHSAQVWRDSATSSAYVNTHSCALRQSTVRLRVAERRKVRVRIHAYTHTLAHSRAKTPQETFM